MVAAGLASKCLIQISYAIGVARPTSVMVSTFGTGNIPDEQIAKLVSEHFDLRPKGIVKMHPHPINASPQRSPYQDALI